MKAKKTITPTLLLTATMAFSGSAQDIEMSSAQVVAPFVLTNGCIFQGSETRGTNSGRAELKFKVEAEGRYYISVQGRGVSGHRQECLIGIDSEPDARGALEYVLTNGVPGQIVPFTTRTSRGFTLSAGNHKLILIGKSSDTRFEKLTLLPEGKVGSPPPPAGRVRVSETPP